MKGSGAWYRGGQALRTATVIPVLSACIQSGIPPIGGTPAQQLARVESMYADTRDLYFQHEIADARGGEPGATNAAAEKLRTAHETLRARTLEALLALDTMRYVGDDRRAIAVMRTTLDVSSPSTPADTGSCRYDAQVIAEGTDGYARLSARIYRCYAAAQSRVVTPRDTADRLTVLGRLAAEPSGDGRRALFLALEPVWRSVNADNTPQSPYRRLIALSAERWRREGSPLERAAASLGLDPSVTEMTLVSILAAWRDRQPVGLSEPWDWYHRTDEVGRRLSPRIALADLSVINDRYFSSLGAAPRDLGIRYDLTPRPGKTPVAFSQFGGLARRGRDGPLGAEPWVFATYREGGMGNLVELLHETGHAVHIAAVFTRPAFADWPDSDPFTEGLADVPALEAYDPVWQQKFLGDSVATAISLRGKFSSIMLDVAWALFELRMHRDSGSDPNVVWSDITSRYLRIAPHPEWSWWAMRGQLVDAPGYMMNYALGAMIAADVRARVRQLRVPLHAGNDATYDWLAARLYRWGLERPSRRVLEDFLGRPLSAASLIAELGRM
jgi:hypothetical protein